MVICDTHAHYDDEAFDEDREALLTKDLAEGGVEFVVNVGASMRGADASARMAEDYPVVYAACGIHPDDSGVFEHAGEEQWLEMHPEDCRFSCPDDVMQHIRELCLKDRTVCVGEIGLDYHWMVEEKEVQKRWFREQMHLADELGLPINVHSRDAAQDTFDLIRENYRAGRSNGGIIHCYSGSPELAKEYVKMGYYIGIGGVVTFKNAKVLKRVVEGIGIEHLVTETDSPYLAPEPERGKRNDSRKISRVIGMIAGLKGMDEEACAQILRQNAHEVYHI